MSTIIAKTISKGCLIPCLLFSVYLLLNGGNYPGGGFVGGVLFVCSISMVYVTYGMKYINARLRPNWWMWFAYGLLFASITACAPLLVRHNFFRSAFQFFHIELFGIHIGEIEIISTMYFDVGIFFVVIGSLLFILTSIADDKVKEPKTVDIEERLEVFEEGEVTLKPKEPKAEDVEEILKNLKEEETTLKLKEEKTGGAS